MDEFVDAADPERGVLAFLRGRQDEIDRGGLGAYDAPCKDPHCPVCGDGGNGGGARE